MSGSKSGVFRTIALATGALAALTLTLALSVKPAGAAFPGPNGRIVFQSLRDGNLDIYVMDADGSDEARLTDNPGGDAWPDWSPDGTKIAYDSFRDGGRDIFVMNANGSAQTNLTGGGDPDTQPAWSHDGEKIAFASSRDGDYDIYVMNADGTAQTKLTNNTTDDTAPAWSPDGTKIAFTGHENFVQADIYAMNSDGTIPTNLTNSAGFDSLAEWSPDGSEIAFHSDRDGTIDVYKMNADGTDQTNLTEDVGGGSAPAWSPDGSKIAFAGNAEIRVMNADGSGAVNLTDNEYLDFTPDWGRLVDSDGDGLADDRDPDTVGDAADALPDSAFHARGHRQAIRSRLDDAEAAILVGDTASARRMLEDLRRHLDGCETGPAPDRDDWIVDCAAQDEVRGLLDTLLASL